MKGVIREQESCGGSQNMTVRIEMYSLQNKLRYTLSLSLSWTLGLNYLSTHAGGGFDNGAWIFNKRGQTQAEVFAKQICTLMSGPRVSQGPDGRGINQSLQTSPNRCSQCQQRVSVCVCVHVYVCVLRCVCLKPSFRASLMIIPLSTFYVFNVCIYIMHSSLCTVHLCASGNFL